MSGLEKIFDSNFKDSTETSNKITSADSTTKALKAGSGSSSFPVHHASSNLLLPKYPSPAEGIPGRGRRAYLDLALIFLLFRFSLLILFFLHLARPTCCYQSIL